MKFAAAILVTALATIAILFVLAITFDIASSLLWRPPQ